MRLIKIREDKYDEYKIQAMFDCYKWDPQFWDNATLSKYILLWIDSYAEDVLVLIEK